MTKKKMIETIAMATEKAYADLQKLNNLYGMDDEKTAVKRYEWYALECLCDELDIDNEYVVFEMEKSLSLGVAK